MLFPVLSNTALTPDQGSTQATIACVLAYTYGLEDCRIAVAVTEEHVLLSGTAPSREAIDMAIGIAADLSSRRVVSDVEIVSPAAPC
ncbi:BON domain-containing protein [Rhizobium sp. PP-F2F-G20b]|nr:BON domain-containing protein [Rhizobium sp. PP-CC-3A-592]PYE43068.1 BON domain-containing protein [Rhizobium sp. PP-F2F-G20b]